MRKVKKTCMILLASAIMLTACQSQKQTKEPETTAETTQETEKATEETTVKEVETTTTEAAETVSAKPSVPLSEDIYSFQAEINGELYSFPMTMEEFTSYGWEMADNDGELSPNSYTTSIKFRTKDKEIYANLFNFGMNTVKQSEATVGGVEMGPIRTKGKDVTFTLPKGITFGVSTLEDVLAAYGEPTNRYDGSIATKLTYSRDFHQEVEIAVDNTTKVVSSIEISNLVPVEGAAESTDTQSEYNGEKSAEVLAYQTPTELGSDIRSFVVDYAGSLYRIPAPVSTFVENGWKILEDKSDMAVAGKNFGWVSLQKDNQILKVIARNYGKDGNNINNCFVTEVKASENGVKLPITLPGNITIGMSKEDLLKALEGQDYEEDDRSPASTNYMVYSYESKTNFVQIYVSKETNKVNSIILSNGPRELPQ